MVSSVRGAAAKSGDNTFEQPPLSIKSLKGQLHLPDQIPGQIQRPISLELFNSQSRRSMGKANTDPDGAFSFSGLSKGLYRLRLSASLGETDEILVRIDPQAKMDHMDLDLGWASCGLYYSDRNKCRPPELKVRSVSGYVSDMADASISNAEVLVIGSDGKLVVQTKSDPVGNIGPLQIEPGKYSLIVRSPGFSTLRANISVDEENSSNFLLLQLAVGVGFGDNCGAAKIR